MKKHLFAIWLLSIVYIAVFIISELGWIPHAFEPIRYVWLPLLFTIWHGSIRYGWRTILMFIAISIVVSNIFEDLSIQTGFPFGHYYYTASLGPKIFAVPFVIGLVYAAAGYVAWTVGGILIGAFRREIAGRTTVLLPLISSFVMVAWDVCFDPTYSTVQKQWIWTDGGGYFGVPLSNFLGWFLTVFVFFQLFSLYLRWRQNKQRIHEKGPLSRQYWLQPIIWYGVLMIGFPITYIYSHDSPITDATQMTWHAGDIYETAAIISIFTMGFICILGLTKLFSPSSESRQ